MYQQKRMCWAIFLLIYISCFSVFAKGKTIKVALALPITGAYSAYGVQLLSGASQAVKDINQVGGILGNKLEIVPYDDRCQPNIAEALAHRLANDKNIHAVIGHACSAATLAAMDSYANKNKLLIVPTATNPKITQKSITTLFRLNGRDDRQGIVPADFMVNDLQSQRIAVLHSQEVYGKELSDCVIERLTELDRTPILYQAISQDTREFSTIISKFKELEVDAVFFASPYSEVGALAKAMYDSNLQIPLIAGDGIALKAFLVAARGRHPATGVMMSFGTDAKDLPENRHIVEEMRKAKLEVNGYSLYAYSAVQVIAAAMNATKSTNSNQLAKWLHHNEVNTVLGLKSWDTNGDVTNADFYMYIWNNNGQYHRISVAKN